MTASAAPLLLIVGSGSRVYREYLLREMALGYRLWLFSEREPSWEAPYLTGHTVVDTGDAEAMQERARSLAPEGVISWNETLVLRAAEVAEALGLPGPSPLAVMRCRDKHETRVALEAANVPHARSVRAASLTEARDAAELTGYPLVLKPRTLNASIGVVKVESPDQLEAGYRLALEARSPDVGPDGIVDILVEEYLDGPEISVDAVCVAGRVTPMIVARKQLGLPPHFEEVGHVVDAADPVLSDPAVGSVVAAAHAAVGFDTGWTHTELRLTGAGPKVVEVDPRQGGDRIPDLGRLALGIEPGLVAAAIACDRQPAIRPTRRRVAAVRFLYPAEDTMVRSVRVDERLLPPAVVAVDVIALPGMDLRLPPAGHLSSRFALIMVVADSEAECSAALDAAAGAVTLVPLRRRFT